MESIEERVIKHVGIYLRISMEKRGENVETLANHRQILLEHCELKGYTFDRYEEVLSGGTSDLNKRKELQRLLENIEQYDAILVVELSRVSRNGLISEQVLQACTDYDKPILTPEKMYDLANNPNDVLMYRFGSIIASQEHGLIGKRSKNNKITMMKAGLNVNTPPYGYTRNSKTKKFEINEEQAEVVRYIFKLHNEGYGSFRIRDILNNEGIKSARGNVWNLPAIKRIIKNEAYKGTAVFHDRKRIKVGGKYAFKTMATIRFENAHTAIIPPDEWHRANMIREARAKEAGFIRETPANKTGITPLKDLLYCDNCKRKLSILRDTRTGIPYTKRCHYLVQGGQKCNNCGIAMHIIEETLREIVANYKMQVKAQLEQALKNDITGVTDDLKSNIMHIDRQIEEKESEFKELIQLAIKKVFTYAEIGEQKAQLTEEIEQLKKEREQLRERLAKTDSGNVADKLRTYLKVIDELENGEHSDEVRNRYYKQFIKRIYYSRIMPDEISKLSTRNPQRKYYPFTIKIEYL